MSQSVLNRDHDEAAFKAVVLGSVVIFALTLLVLRLGWLQIMFHQHYVNQAVENSTRVTFLRAPRGSIYDRHGNLLATNKQSLSLIAVPAALNNMEEMSVRLSKILSLDKAEVLNRLMKAKASGLVLPVVIEHDLDMDIVSRFYEQKIFLEGIDILPDISRTYPNADATAHVLGYCREITESQLKDRPQCKMGDVCGQAGLEKLYDDQLRGVDGEQRVRVNASGHAFSAETSKPVVTKKAKPGLPIVISLDVDLQRRAYELLAEKSGALVGCDPRSGEVLFLASRPSFDPNVFTRRMTKEDRKVLNSPSHPLHNRALSGFPPGSIWKPVTLLAALDKKVVKPDTMLMCTGGISLGGFTFHDWTGKSARYNLIQCMQWSRDTAFYQMALGLEPEDIKKWGNRFGAGRPTGIELPNERSGLVPDAAWKRKRLHEAWYKGNTLHMSIGQTFLQVSPAQAARMYAGFAMKGRVPFLHFVIKIADRQIPAPKPEYWKVNPVHMKILSDGLKAVVEAGTAGRSRIPEVPMSGKTGSAEAPPKGSKTHGWFACYAPSDKPELACCGFVEHGGHGGVAAAPLVKQMVEMHFGVKRTPLPGAAAAAAAKAKLKAKPKPKRT